MECKKLECKMQCREEEKKTHALRWEMMHEMQS